MGALVGLQLAAANPERVAGLVVMVPALRVKSRVTELAPLIAPIQKYVKIPPDAAGFFDKSAIATNQNYATVPTRSLVEFLKLAKVTRDPAFLTQIKTPLLAIGATHDKLIQPEAARNLYQQIGSEQKQVKYFDGTGHEMLRDAQKEAVLDEIESYLVEALALKQKSV